MWCSLYSMPPAQSLVPPPPGGHCLGAGERPFPVPSRPRRRRRPAAKGCEDVEADQLPMRHQQDMSRLFAAMLAPQLTGSDTLGRQ